MTLKKKQLKNWQQIEEPTEKAIAEYLQRHPDFFSRHKDLLAKLEIPHDSDEAVSLQERKLAVLREENQQLQRKLGELVVIAQQNEQLNQRVQRLVAALTNVDGVDEFFHTLYSMLCNEFNTDTVVMRCFEVPHSSVAAERQEFVEYDAQIFTLFESLLENNKPICGELSPEQIEYLFSNSQIASAALIPLGTPEPQGLLAMGSHDASRFHADMGTDFLTYLGKIVSHLLRIWVRPL